MLDHHAIGVLGDYYDALGAGGDPTRIATFFHLPAILIVGDVKVVFSSTADVVPVYERAMQKYRAEGVVGITWDSHETTLVTIYSHLVLIKTVVTRVLADGTPVKRWPCSYLMRECKGRWGIDVATAIPN